MYLNIGKHDLEVYESVSWSKIAVEPIGNLHYEKELTLPEELKIDKAELDIYIKGQFFETIDLFKEGEWDSIPDRVVEMIEYERIFEEADFIADDIKVLIRIVDKFGLDFEKEIEIRR